MESNSVFIREISGRSFPLVITAQADEDECWISTHFEDLHQRLIEHGAILFRNFPVENAERFESMLDATKFRNMPYIGGAAPRTQVTASRVVTANESPPTEKIPFHHEMAQVPNPPGYIFFYCDIAAESGGATSLLHSAEICDEFFAIDPDYAAMIEQSGVRYIRTMPEETDPQSAIGRSWKETFQVQTRKAAEVQMQAAGMSWEWLADGNLKTITAILPAIRLDPETQRKVFFNSVVAAYTGWNDSRNQGEKAVVTADGEPINAQVMQALVARMNELAVNFPWQAGDMLWLNNYTVLHARQSYTGDRRVLASIAYK